MTRTAPAPPPAATTAIVVVVMGVSGSGKSTLATRLASGLDWDFLEGDLLHPSANVAKMSAGEPLDDADRQPWLQAIAAWIAEHLRAGRNGVVACSALRRTYRDVLRRAGPGVRFVYLQVSREVLHRRLRQRQHFMPASLLDSQLVTLEEPDDDEHVLYAGNEGDIEATVASIRHWLESKP